MSNYDSPNNLDKVIEITQSAFNRVFNKLSECDLPEEVIASISLLASNDNYSKRYLIFTDIEHFNSSGISIRFKIKVSDSEEIAECFFSQKESYLYINFLLKTSAKSHMILFLESDSIDIDEDLEKIFKGYFFSEDGIATRYITRPSGEEIIIEYNLFNKDGSYILVEKRN